MNLISILAQASPPATAFPQNPDEIVSLDPTQQNALPGVAIAEQIINGLGKYALMAALVGIVISAGLWAIGAHSQNFSQTYNGKKGVAVSIGAAIIIGAAAFLVNLFYGVGQEIS